MGRTSKLKTYFFTRIFDKYLVMLKHKLHTSSKIRSCSRTELSIRSLHIQRRTVYNMLMFIFQDN